ncbi:MAG: hypothetical protein ACTSRL_14400 [Candidatus Helarchaeota archaeon]|nr:hypothetical protein [Deltaproteobacteria bacterium]
MKVRHFVGIISLLMVGMFIIHPFLDSSSRVRAIPMTKIGNPLHARVTGNQTKTWTNFSSEVWAKSRVQIDPLTNEAYLDYYGAMVSTKASSYATYHANYIKNSFTRTWYDDDVTWHTWSDVDNDYFILWLYFQNPSQNRQYYRVEFGTKFKWWRHTNWCGNLNPWWEAGASGGRVRGIEATAACNTYQRLTYSFWSTPSFPRSDLGDVWAPQVYQKLVRFQKDPWDETTFHWDYAYVKWWWYEYYTNGTLTLQPYTIGDEDHSFKLLQEININATAPLGTALQLFFKAYTPLGWTPQWIPIANGSPLNVLASDVQIRIQLLRQENASQSTPLLHSVTMHYGDPPPTTDPYIHSVSQDPDPTAVGYKNAVNVSAVIETYAPLSQVYLNYTLDNWTSFQLSPMTDSFDIGTSTYTGLIPPVPYNSTVRYVIYAENVWANETRNVTSSEFTYISKDNVPPAILHTNSSTWVSPLHPLPSVSSVRIECAVTDEVAQVEDVLINITFDTQLTVLESMSYNLTTSRYFYDCVLMPSTQYFYYTIIAGDTNSNWNHTPQFAIRIDREGPAISSLPFPRVPEAEDSVTIVANITDPNGVSSVQMWWTWDAWVHYQGGVLNNTGNDQWRTVVPIPPFPYRTLIEWQIEARDGGGNLRTAEFEYRVDDHTPPQVVAIAYPTPVVTGRPLPINITIREAEGASGFNPDTSYFFYRVQSDPTTIHGMFLKQVQGDVWGAVIPPQLFNETVTFWVYLEDNAGNNLTSEEYSFQVVEMAALVDWGHFLYWVFLAVGITGVLLVVRRQSNRLTGSAFTGLGAVVLIAMTAVLWSSPYSFLNMGNLTFQEWLHQLGESGEWFSLIMLFFSIFLVFAIALGSMYSYDRRRSEWRVRLEGIEMAVDVVNRCLEELEELEGEGR